MRGPLSPSPLTPSPVKGEGKMKREVDWLVSHNGSS